MSRHWSTTAIKGVSQAMNRNDQIESGLRDQPITFIALVWTVIVFAGGMIYVALSFPGSLLAWLIYAISCLVSFGFLFKAYFKEVRGGFTHQTKVTVWRILNFVSLGIGAIGVVAAALPAPGVSLLLRGRILVGCSAFFSLYFVTRGILKRENA